MHELDETSKEGANVDIAHPSGATTAVPCAGARPGLAARLLGIAARSLVAAALAGLLVGGTMALHQRADANRAENRPEPHPLPVATLVLEDPRPVTITETFVGRIEPERTTSLAFERGGLVTEVLADEGDWVDEGAPVARLDTALLEAERDRLRGERRRLEAELSLARLTEERQRRLHEGGHAPLQRLDEAVLARTALDGAIEAIEAAIRRVEIELDKSTLPAPFAGTVGARFSDRGAIVEAGTPVVELLETGRPLARIGVTPEVARTLATGQRVDLAIDGQRIDGRVRAVRPDLSTATRTASVLVDVPATAGARFGDTVTFTHRRALGASGHAVPVSALKDAGRGLWSLMTIIEDGSGGFRIGREAVELLHVEGGTAIVRGTVRPGQRIVAAGLNRLVPGQSVVPAEAVADAAEAAR